MAVVDEIMLHKKMAETQFVFSLYSDVELFLEYKIDPKIISDKSIRYYYMLLDNMISKKKLSVIDSVNTALFMSQQSSKSQAYYEKCGGWDTIEEGQKIIESENVNTYYNELIRYEAFIKLSDLGYDLDSKWNSLKSLTYEELSATMEGGLAEVFTSSDLNADKVVDIKSGMRTMVENANKGLARGLPLYSKMLNSQVNGMALGNITMLAGASGVGKTNVTLNQVLPQMIKEKEPLLIMCNEEEIDKWQQEIITWVANNVLKKEFEKSRFFVGDFSKEEARILEESIAWLEKRLEDGMIDFVNFNMFSMDKSIRLIRKYIVQKDVRYFIIDTLKLDNDVNSKVTDQAWLQLQQNMVKLYNVIKPSAYNAHVWVTYQLNKSQRTRYLDQTSLGMSKNVADVVSTLLLIRNVLESEKAEATRLAIKGKRGEVILREDGDYMIVFIDKNRRGSTQDQIVFSMDKGRNIMKDVGFTRISQDY